MHLKAEIKRDEGRRVKAARAELGMRGSLFMKGFSQNSTDVGRALGWVLVIYAILFPLLYVHWGAGLMIHHDLKHNPGIGPGQAVAVSFASVAGLSVGDYTSVSAIGALVQALESVLAVSILGYVIWMFTRSYDES